MICSTGDRILRGTVDMTSRSGYTLLGARPRTPHEVASEYYQFDWEYAQTPEQSSWLASSWVTYPFYASQSRLLFRRAMIKSPTRSQIVLVCRNFAAYHAYSREITSHIIATKADFLLRTSCRLTNVDSRASFSPRLLSFFPRSKSS